MNRLFTHHVFSLNRNVRLALCCIVLALTSFSATAQITVTESSNNAAARALVEDVLLGSCVTVSNITYSAPSSQASGIFNGAGTNLGLDSGIILASGRATNAIGPDNANNEATRYGAGGDADLTALAGINTRDAVILEFDFIPSNDTLRFNYIFGSEEYPEWVNAGYNDVFGFFISGPGIAGPFTNAAENIALIPGTTTAVAIDNVNNGQSGTEPATGPCTNCAFYVDNSSGTDVQYDAFTTVFTAEAVVTACQSYHIKLAIADAGDDRYDSGVFLEEGSFSAGGGVTVEIETTTIPPGIYEGCSDAWFIFRRVDGADNTNAITAGFVITGTATPGVDYTALPSTITIPAGQDSILVDLNVALDFVTEGAETIIVTLEDPPCACEAPASATVTVLDNDIPIAVSTTGTTTICLGQSADLTADPSGSRLPYTASWNNGAPAGEDITVSPTNTTTYTYSVTDNCGTQTISSSETITVIRPDFTVDDDEQCLDGNSFAFTNTGASGGSVTHLWEFGDSNSSNSENPTHSYLADGDFTVTHYIIFTASSCTASVSALVTVYPEPVITATVNQDVICSGGTDGVISTSVSGGTSGFTYAWSPGGQTTSSITGQSVGTYTITVTDANGCTDSDSETIIQTDPVDPTAVCQNITIQLNGSGNATISATDVDNGSSDNCGIASMVVSPNAFTCSELGANTVTLTVTDVNGNTDDCTATVTVQDNINPIAVCQNITVQLDASGNASITAADVDGGSSDNCSVSVSATPLVFTCAEVGANTVVLTATDPTGNSNNCNATVTVEDNVDPTAICQDVSLILNGSGILLVQPTDIDNGSNDACGISGMFANPAAFDCSDIGANSVTLTVTDNNGNVSTCVSTVTVVDDEDPTAICQNITVQLNASGNATITTASVDNGSNDNCSLVLTATPLSFTCANTGTNNVTLTATDPSGNTDNCVAVVTIEDNVDPTAVCQNITIQLDASGNASVTAASVDNGSNDNCSVSLSAAPLSFTCANTGTNNVTLTATDPSGNTDNCVAVVTIEDDISPTAICQNITVQLDGSGNATIVAADVDNGSNDNCSVSLSATPLSFTCANTGTNSVTLTATDPSGNTDDCIATVTIEDDIDPTATCQNITVQLDGTGNASIVSADIDGGSTDNCSGFTVTPTPNTFTCANIGVNSVTLTVTDASGNISTCVAVVTIEDNVDPTAICQNITVQLDASGNATITAADVDGGSTDNCSVTVSATPLSFTCANVGANSVTLTATDGVGNTDNCTATVIVEDNVDPTPVCQNITVQLDAAGNATISATDVDNGSSDNCAVASLVVSPNSFTCANIGVNTVTLTVTDVNGNTSTCNATVTVEDNINPSALCQNITVQLDANGDLTIASADIDGGSTDNCGVATLTIDGGNTSQDFDCLNVGANTVTLTVTDVNGNTSTCDATVTIEDSVDPIAVCQNITVQLDANGDLTITSADIDNGSADACGIASLEIDGGNTTQDFDCSNVGANTVTLTVTDVNGNVSTCDATVTVEDDIDPTAVCQNITVQLDGSGDLTITSADIDNGSNDNCGIASLTIDGGNANQDFDCSDVGSTTVTLTVTDVNGNVSTCDATVTIEDDIDPTAVCQNITIQLDASGNATLSTVDIDNGSNDNCGIASITLDGGASSLSFDCSDVGTTTVTLTVTDVNSNVSTCTADVTIEDNIDANAICQDITVQLDANGDLTVLAADIDNGSSDNCGTTTITIDGGNPSQDFDCSDVGVVTITLTVTDANSNVSTCDADVTIEDSVDPAAVCQNITVQLDANGDLTLTSASIDGGSTDNCGVASVTIDGGNTSQDFDCSDVGVNTITLTVTDVNGNTSTCDATVTIEDTVDPTAVCQNITVQLDANGDLTLTSASIDGGSTDNCGVASVTIDGGNTSQDFDCSDVGANTISLTVTDVNGNTSTCDATVTIEDSVDPIAVCQNITVQLDASGNATITGASIDNGSADNCGVASLVAGPNSFDCSNIGVNTVTLTVTDVNGNTSTCTASVTIEDNVDPTAVCQNITVQLDANGDASITASQVDNGSTDNCAIDNLAIDVSSFDCNDLGTNLITLTVTDVNGNSSTCQSTVTVEDNVDPNPTCQNIVAELDATGNVTVAAGDVDNGSTDNCAIQSITLSPNTFNCSNVGANSVTLTVTDASGNVATCSASVDVQDNVLPSAICQDITVQLDGSGNATITPNLVNNGSADACGSVTPTIVTPAAFDCSNIGSNIVTLTVEDQNGNTSTCAATVTIEDNVDPTPVCQNITVQLDGTGNVSITPAQVDNGSSDNCAIDFMTVSPNSFTCAEEGANAVVLTVTDVNGNSATCSATVTVENNVTPAVSCQDITVQLDATGNVSIVAADVDGGSNAACGIASLTVDPSAFTCANVGPNTVTLTGTDNSGNTSTCTAIVTVEDNIDPTAVCQDITIQLDANGDATIVAADIDNGSSDNCGIGSLVLDVTAFDCDDVGTNAVVLTVTDVNANTSTCAATVTVEDDIDPTIVCQNFTVVLDAAGNASITALDIDNGTTDNCGTIGSGITLDVTPSTFDCSDVSTTTVTLTATDDNGNSSTCTATVTVQDNTSPTALCQDVTIYLDAAGNAGITAADIDNGSSDNCGIAGMTVTPSDFSCSGVGPNPVTLTVTDVNANVASCSATVTVVDTISPTAVCQNITVQLDAAGTASIVPSQINNGSSDVCGIASLVLNQTTFDCSEVGANTVTLTVTDVNGNASTCSSTVTLEDNVDPTAVCQNITVQLDAAGTASIVAADVDGGSTDNCSVASLAVSPNTFNCANVGANNVTLTVTDVNGNTSTCTADVTVEDNIDPTAICQNITVQLDANGDLTIASADIDNGSADACGIASLAIDGGNTSQNFTCAEVGANTVTLTVTDNNGNVSTCDATVTVEDNVDPTAVCQNITVQLDGNGDLSITSADIDGGSTDACGIASLTIDGGNTSQDFDCSSIGTNTVTLTVTDVNGNVSTCDASVTVEDNVDPTMVCQNITVQLDANGDASIVGVDLDGGTTDNCNTSAQLSFTTDVSDFDCLNVGPNTITLTATDTYGNSSICTATVTIEDNVNPVAVCQNITVQLDATGNVFIAAADVDGGSSDACGIASLAVNQDAFVCAEVGANTVTLTVTDNNGNSATCDATVTVEDNVDPTPVCQSITVQLDGTGNAAISATDVDNGSSDACGIASLVVSPNTFTCAEEGVNTVTLTVTDVNGNSSTCTATVTVENNVTPAVSCQDITVQLDATGNVSIVAADVDGGSNAACGIASLTVDPSAFTCANVGPNTVTLTGTDNSGNTSTCTAVVTVLDTISPTAVCQNITVQLDANGDLTIASADIDGGSTDACGIASLEIDNGNTNQSFDCSEVGANTVTLTVTDVNGNASTCDATVTVEDNVDPNAICQNITVQLDANGDLTITSADIDNGSNDNCGIASLEIDGGSTSQDFDCSNVGANTVTLTVTDVNGNASTCDATVTVEDNVDPNAVCQNITVQLDASGNVSINSMDIDGGSNDNCGIASVTVDGGSATQAFDCSEVGANTVTLTVTDVNGNVSTCDATVTVEDNVDPNAICQNITVQLDATGNATISSVDLDGGSSDNCGIATFMIDGGNTTMDFDCADEGTNTITLTVTDVNGNVSTCDATVTVENNVNPNVFCQNITVYLDATGNVSIIADDVNGGSNASCGLASLTVSPDAFDCSNIGPNTVTLTAVDNSGNTSTCDAIVTVLDTISPTAVCQNITVQLDANGDLTIASADVDGGSADNCGIASLEIDGGNTSQDFDCSNVGANTVTLTVTDVNGNVSTCDAIVTVEDTISPNAVCQSITVQLDANGELTITSADIDNGSNDNCGIASLEIDGGNTTQDFDCSNVGANTVTLTVTDVNGNASTCDATVTVEDNVNPNAICQAITVQLDANGDLTITSADIDNGSNDNCGIASLEIDGGSTSQDFDCSNVGANTVTLTVTDVNGNVSTCDAIVTVEDTISPNAVCQSITVQLDANGELTITSADIDNGSNDNCGIASLEIDGGNTTQDFDCSNVGANTVTLTVTDVNGNVSTCDATVTVEDNVDPNAICQDITVQLDANGELTITSADIDNGSNDNCGIASLEIDGGNTTQDFDCSNVGANTVTLTVTDVNGNVSTCDAIVTVEDTISPNAVCQSITVQLDANGELTITSADIDNGSNDNCGIASLEIDGGNTTQDFDCSNVGANTVTLTVTDVNGNASTCDATVTVEDNVDPNAICQNITVQLDANGDLTITSADIDNGSNDNCGIASLEIDGGNTSQDFDCSNVDANTVTLTVTDVNNNVSTCDAVVTVQDTVSPTAICQDITVQLDANGELTITSADIDNGSNDNCGIASLEIDGGNTTQDFDCSNVGANTVTLTVTDVNGNVSTCDATVTVEDNVDPNAICQNITVQLDANGDLTITSADIDNGSNDNCGIASLEIDGGSTSQDFDCSNVGANTVTLTVTDVNGNVSTCDATVTVEDNVDPNAVCQNITVQLDANGDLTIASADVDGGSADNCGIASLEIDGGNTSQDFDCSNVGANTVTLTVTDVNGNVSTCDATVTVQDTISPIIVCQNITIELNPSGTVVLTAVDLDGGTTDNCGSVTFDIDAADTQWTCADVGVQTVMLTATDANGNTSTCDAQVTIENNVVPTVSCQNITVYLDGTGNISIDAEDVNGGSNASCGLASLTVSPDVFDCSNIGANTVTLTATDSTGNVTTCNAIVTVLDTISPTAICQNITVDLDANGDIIIDAIDLNGGSADNCAVASVTVDSGQSNTILDCSSVGANTITLTVTDVNGNVSTCDATVTVEDNTNPTAECASVTVQLDANGETIITPVLVDNGSSDNCGIDSLSVLPASLNCNNIGTNSIVLTVWDVNGNISTCVATVTAQDTISPTPVCTDITVQLDPNGDATIAAGDIDDGSFDNCGIQSLAIDVNAFTCSEIGGNTVELTVTDVNGNSSTCTANANVVDEVDPNVICQNLSVYLDANGQVTITAADIDNGSTDACGIDTMTLSVYTFDCSDIGVNPVTLTVTDNYGNFDICQSVVRVFDTISPVTICQDIIIQLDATGTASIVAADVDGGSTDNCGIDALSVDQNIFDCTQVGDNTVTLTVVDVNGNQSTCDATVTVEDNVNPNANCQDITIYLDGAGNASINASDINGGSNANCGVDTVFVSQMDFDCSNVGNNTVTLTVVDNNGNQSTCTANVEVLDTISPTAICQDLTLQLNGSGQASTTAAAVNNGSFDNCAIATLTIDQADFDCSVVGLNTVTLTVTDVNGNVSTCTSQIAIEETISPNATCTPVVVQLGANGTASITAEEVDLNSSDNCAIDTMTLNQYTFDCSQVGSNTVTLTVTDVNGNSSTCTANVIVEENVPPVTACQDITIYLDVNGDAAILPADVDAGSTDNCAIDTMYVTPNDFTCSGVGANPVVLTVVDLNGNVSSCNAVITVNDTISPIAICQDIVVQLDSLGNASIDAEEIDNGSSDACGITGFTVDVNTFDCANVGGNTVVLTVEDNNGNTSTCSATVTIEDNIDPIVNCSDLTVILDGNGTVNVSAGEFIDSSSDNCAIDTIFATQIDFSCADLGSNIITITVIDVNGNSATCSSELTVLDTLSPVIIACPMDSVIVPDSSDCSPQVFWTEPTATDNCTPTLTSDFAPGDNFPVGTTTVTYTATDESNNSTTCSFDITIEPSPVVVEITSPEGPCGYNLSCSSFPNGEATANVSGGCLPYDYVWTDGQTTQTATDLAAGLHGVTVTDANGTSVVQTITLTEPNPLTTDSLVSPEYVGGANISCNGEFDGAVSINVLGGEECVTYDYAWTGPNGFTSADEDLTGLEAGTYVVVVSDASGCSYTDSITLIEPDALDVDSLLSDFNGSNISCGGAADGAIDLTISGGATPYTVSWNTGETTEDIDSLEAGTYIYTVIDANGCSVTDSITLTEPIGLTSAITTSDYNGVNISCFGLANGSIDLTVNDGTQPYSFLWNNGETTEDIDSIQAGTYIVNITDANGCTLTDSVTLVGPDDIVVNPIDTTIISCNGLEDGAFTVEAIGGVPAFTYDWSDGQTGPTADSLGVGTYIVVATDLNGCQDSISLLLTEPAVLEASVVQVYDVICFSENNGIVDVNVLGGTFPYTYDWSNDSTAQDLNGVAAGTYSLEVTDANGCTDTLSVVVDEPTELTLSVDTVINATCSGAENGSITVEANGGTAPYTYTWPNLNLTGPTVGGLSAGVYEVQVEDANGCSWSMNVTVGQPTSIEAQLDVQSHVSCNGLADGSALVTVSGGTAPYTYFWSNSDTDSLATGFAAGIHTVNVSDAGGCDTTLTFVIDEPDVLVISIDTLYNVTCNGAANGQIEVDIEGGTIPYTATWSNGDVGYVANDLGAGAHTIFVTDGNGCMDSLTTIITEPDTLELLQVSTTNVLCKGGDDGEATVLAQGGTAPLTYNWPLIGQTGNTATNLGADTYTFVITDANGCTYTDTVQITEPDAINVIVTSDTAVCPGNGVTITASATGGAGNYSYSWDNGLGLGASHFVSPTVATTYTVEVFDQSGCAAGAVSVTVDIAAPPTAAFTSSASAPCILPTDIEFTNLSTGATNYEWFLGNGTVSSDENPTATYSNAGTYTVTLIASSGAGCSDTVTGTVIIDDVPTADFTLTNTEGCAPLVVNFGNNSTTGLEYSWDFGDGTTSTISNPIHVYDIPGDYEVTLVVTSAGGCTDTLALGAAVSAYPSPIADFTPNQVTFPEPGNEYEFVNNSSGASLYNWDFGNDIQTDEFQPTYDFPAYGGYFITLTAINEFGCADTAVHYINVELFTSLHVPNAMGIGEIGEASIFLPKGTGIAEYHVWIFDNWGNQLWESTRLENGSPAEGWDGYYKGSTVPQGSYVWKINATFADGKIWDGEDFSNGKRGNSGTIMVLY